jgi:hypothetical protein
MPRKIVVAICWSLIFAVILVLAVILGFVIGVIVIPLAIVALMARRLMRSAQKGAVPAVQAKFSAGTAGMTGLLSTRSEIRTPAKSIPCEHVIRGKGTLQVYQDGSLQFDSSKPGWSFFWPCVGIHPEQTSPWKLILRKCRFLLSSSFRRELVQQGVSMFLPWHSLRGAVAAELLDKGRSLVIAHAPPAEGQRCEEFSFSTKSSTSAGLPPPDPAALVRDLGLPDPSPASRRDILHWRNRFNWHLALTFFLFKQIDFLMFWLPVTVYCLVRYWTTGAKLWTVVFTLTADVLMLLVLGIDLFRQKKACSDRSIA